MNLAEALKGKNTLDEARMKHQLDEVKSLLSHEEAREREILSMLGVDACVKQYEDKQSLYLEKQDLKKKYATDIFHIDQIKELCVNYNLRFLPSQLYQGWIDTELGPKVKRFIAEKKVSDYDLETSFFVMAPEKEFELKNIEEIPQQYDPLLFYRIDEVHYCLVHQWGSDLSTWRFISAFRKRSFFHSQVNLFFVIFFITMGLMGFVAVASLWISLSVALVISGGLTFLRYGHLRNDNKADLNEKYSVNLWNKNIKYT